VEEYMINWQEHSREYDRLERAAALGVSLAAVHEASRNVMAAEAKLKRQRAAKNVAAVEKTLREAQAAKEAAQAVYLAGVREMCHLHLDFNIDDIVEVCSKAGTVRQPIVVEDVEFCRRSDDKLYLRVQGLLLEESNSGRPQLRQGFDVLEDDPARWLVRLN
jgi:hypothetical protein